MRAMPGSVWNVLGSVSVRRVGVVVYAVRSATAVETMNGQRELLHAVAVGNYGGDNKKGRTPGWKEN